LRKNKYQHDLLIGLYDIYIDKLFKFANSI